MGFVVGYNMSRMPAGQLNVRKIEGLEDGVHGDGGNLYLTIKGQARHWTVRYFSPVTNKRREIGIGSAYILTLAKARQMAIDIRRQVADGIDPLELKSKAKKQKQIPNFAELAERYIEEQQTGWKDPRSAHIWRSSLSRMAYPVIGSKIVSSIDTDDILAVLKPIWTTKTETADRVRGRIERILDYAATHHWREGDNPARWKGNLSNILPKPSSVTKVQHHAAIE
ncbi:Integrase/recombinase [Commensalibacter communis]|nr:Integrase/recombinase [Commensalibacter communis]CAI3956753.1 Integrase/recombinase [Commensalibacter communis]